MSAQENEFLNYVLDLLQAMGAVKSRKMFGGYGIFMDGLMFAIIVDDVLYLKVDDESETRFAEEGLSHFVYNRQGKDVQMSFCLAPDSALEDVEVMNEWADVAFQSAVRAAASKR
ncbi:TfoX/Sxy family protein [Pseudodesulfovibrio sp. zrk46]|uniref:TfoX/Sxy family protein n=1 Tax=Pseudodesulfovibrio sp. zrk46 TaxID=2725288 RepID=UPI0014497C7C|nr:TfoX/Sxy family protein [Pseudodesulfovibrio sp. zrk46]QJB57342.1 TfoX/Sxy family protein [Pseudodesulfovibrio sp. zrk46]